MSHSEAFTNIRARALGLLIFLSWMVAYGFFPGHDSSWSYVVRGFFCLMLLLFLLVSYCAFHGVSVARLVGRLSEPISYIRLTFSIVLPVFVFSVGAIYLVFLPLSYVAPEFVDWWLLDAFGLLIWESETLPLVPNLVNFLIIVALGPALEELLFRGLLLHRWAKKWETKRAMIYSSLLFGALHPDFIGAFLFGYVMAVIYIQSKSLLVPIAAHALNNMLAWMWNFFDVVLNGYEYTIADFQSDWWLGTACLILSTPWLIRFLRRHWPRDGLPLPYYG